MSYSAVSFIMLENKEILYMSKENTEAKMQYILDENGELAEITKDKCKPVEYPINYKLKNAFEVFVRVDDTENYWISNYGRCVNNYLSVKNSKKDSIFIHDTLFVEKVKVDTTIGDS